MRALSRVSINHHLLWDTGRIRLRPEEAVPTAVNLSEDTGRRLFTLGSFVLNYRSDPHFCATFFPKCRCCINLTKNGLGYISGDFFTASKKTPQSTLFLLGEKKFFEIRDFFFF
jgi:hypothetical protein